MIAVDDGLKMISLDVRRNLLARGFIPLTELEHHPNCPSWFSLAKAEKRAHAMNKDIADFFYSPRDLVEPYLYYNGLAFVGFSPDEPELAENIDQHERACREAFQSHNFTTLFDNIVDKRIALTAYQHLFDLIPDEDKYNLFLRVYCRSESGFGSLPEEIVRKAVLFRKTPLFIPGADHNGFVDIYRGMTSKSTPLHRAFSWTLNLRTAICFAIRFRLGRETGEVYRITVHQDKIVAYITDRREDEVIVLPSNIKDELRNAQNIKVIGLRELESEVDVRAITEQFETWSSYLKPEYFRNPSGIHGIGHTKRVLFLCLVLAYGNELTTRETDVICKAALYHDIGRTHDGVDSLHGLKSYQKIAQLDLLKAENTGDRRLIQFIIENHSVDDKTAKGKLPLCHGVDPNEAWLLYSMFKDADGLDRVRLRDLDPEKLRTQKAKELILLAEQLLERIKA